MAIMSDLWNSQNAAESGELEYPLKPTRTRKPKVSPKEDKKKIPARVKNKFKNKPEILSLLARFKLGDVVLITDRRSKFCGKEAVFIAVRGDSGKIRVKCGESFDLVRSIVAVTPAKPITPQRR